MAIGTIEQAEQARKELASKNQKIIYQLPRELLIAGKPVKIFNVSSQKWTVSMGGMGTWTIQACEPEERVSPPLEIPFIMSEGITTDMEHIEFRQTAGQSFAESVIGIGAHRHPSEDLRRWGIFIAAGEQPTSDEIEKAKAQLRARFMEMVQEADGYYGDGPGEYKNITKRHRDALDWLLREGVDVEDRPWHKPLKAMAECPACSGKIPPGAVKCPHAHCGAVLDWERAYQFGMVSTPERPSIPPKQPSSGKGAPAR